MVLELHKRYFKMNKRNATESSNGYIYEKVIIHVTSLRNYDKNFKIYPEEGEDYKLVYESNENEPIYDQIKHKYDESLFDQKDGAFMKHFNDNYFVEKENDKYIFKISCLGFNQKQLKYINNKEYEKLFTLPRNTFNLYDKDDVMKLLSKTEIKIEKDFTNLLEEAKNIIGNILKDTNTVYKEDLCEVISIILLHNITYNICTEKRSVYTKNCMMNIINKYKNLNVDDLIKYKNLLSNDKFDEYINIEPRNINKDKFIEIVEFYNNNLNILEIRNNPKLKKLLRKIIEISARNINVDPHKILHCFGFTKKIRRVKSILDDEYMNKYTN